MRSCVDHVDERQSASDRQRGAQKWWKEVKALNSRKRGVYTRLGLQTPLSHLPWVPKRNSGQDSEQTDDFMYETTRRSRSTASQRDGTSSMVHVITMIYVD